MCSIYNIRNAVMVFGYIKAFLAVYIFGAGIYLSSSNPINQAFGLKFVGYGTGLALLGVTSGAIVWPLRIGMKHHNKFLLLFSFGVDAVCLIFLLQISISIIETAIPVFPKSLQLDCLSYERKTNDSCTDFFQSDRTAGFRLFWEGYYSLRGQPLDYEVLSTIEDNGVCCGFFAPLTCIPDTRSFPSDYSEKGVDGEYTTQRVTCGNIPLYYPQIDNCLNYYNDIVVPPIVGGCNYDLGVSYCLSKSLDSNSRGCASQVEDYAIKIIEPHGFAIAVVSSLNLLMMIYACCMWWKRKEYDVFPEFGHEIDKFDQRKAIDKFQITPYRQILYKEGFLPSSNTIKPINNSPALKNNIENHNNLFEEELDNDLNYDLTSNNIEVKV